ncbi:MAG: N-acetylmuramidase domain-containing protein, partial [Phormidesmis sp.]
MNLKQLLETGQILDYSEVSTDSRLLDSTLISEIQQILVCAGYHQAIKGFSVDGLWGRLTRQALNTFKEEALLGEPDVLDIVSAKKLLSFATSEFKYTYPPVLYGKRAFVSTIAVDVEQAALSPQDYTGISKEFGLEVAAVRAVVEVESAGSGFLIKEPPPARPKILFEAHIFYRETPKPVSKSRPDLSSAKYNRSLYKG